MSAPLSSKEWSHEEAADYLEHWGTDGPRQRKESMLAIAALLRRAPETAGEPYLHDGANGVHGFYCIARKRNGVTEYWTGKKWAAFCNDLFFDLRESAQKTRAPLPPDVLADALQDVVHKDEGESRAAAAVRTPLPTPAPHSKSQQKRFAAQNDLKAPALPDFTAGLLGESFTPELEAEFRRRVEAAGYVYGGVWKPGEPLPSPRS